MTIEQLLRKLPYKKQLYVKYKFNLWFNKKENYTEEEFLRMVDLKSMSTYERWERTEEFKHITAIVLACKQANDLIEVYEQVKLKVAENPDKGTIEMMMKLMKEIDSHKKQALKHFSVDEDIENDELELQV